MDSYRAQAAPPRWAAAPRCAAPFAAMLMAALACTFGATTAAAQASEIANRIRARIEAGLTTESFDVMDERVHARATLRRFYPTRDFEPVWITEDGPAPHAEDFIAWLETGPRRQGLTPTHYHLEAVESMDIDRLGALVDMELALSDAFLIVGSHFLAGRLNPESLDSEWFANRRHRDLAPLLAEAPSGAGELLESLLPTAPEYAALVNRLGELRQIRDTGGWQPIEPGPTLRQGDTGPRVGQLVARLTAGGDYSRPGTETGSESAGATVTGRESETGTESQSAFETFDEAVATAVISFQRRHGLAADGAVGRATLAALNVPIQSRINQIVVNLERWRWLPETLGERHVIVNIAGFYLDFVERGETTLSMRVVVGRPYRRTPVFSDAIRYLVLNPSWEVPTRIATTDKLPLIKADPSYISDQGYQLLRGWGADEQRIDPSEVDWSTITARNFPYRLRQSPGPLNALGRVKFMFPNTHSVYLHDTPSRELFAEDARAFSSGCIRLERPFELAELLLAGDSRWSREAIDRALASGREQTVSLREPVPVHLLYWTVWVDSTGTLQFRDDIYGRDEPVLRELGEDPPT